MPIFFDDTKTQGLTRIPVVTLLMAVTAVIVYVFTHADPATTPLQIARWSFPIPRFTVELAGIWPFGNIGYIRQHLAQAQEMAQMLPSSAVNVWATLITHQFIHADVAHIAGNMSFLLIFGRRVEHELGGLLYVPFLLICGIFAAMGQWVDNIGGLTILAGMSGSIAGIMGGQLVLNRTEKLLMGLPAIMFIGKFLFDNYMLATAETATNVAFLAHFFGFLAGAFLVGPFMLLRRLTRRDVAEDY